MSLRKSSSVARLQFAPSRRRGYDHIWRDWASEYGRQWRMRVTVELFGIPRAKAGIAQTSAIGSNLGDVLADLARRHPPLADVCIEGRALRPGYIVNLSAERFVSSPETVLREGDTVLLLSLDAGG